MDRSDNSRFQLITLKQGISTTDHLGAFSFYFEPLRSHDESLNPNLIRSSSLERQYLDQVGLESTDFFVKIESISQPLECADGPLIASYYLLPKWDPPKSLRKELASSIVVKDSSIKFTCSSELLKTCATPIKDEFHTNTLQVTLRLSQSVITIHWTVFRQSSLPALPNITDNKASLPMISCCLLN
ncbi:hypothetical protein O181_006409 [Austropuccinia psidii MF-1]|uniref:Uncharacterized protein n=1 Tax=Austropuccinia psidii MF-1 TaxID=1389203 RepID=A0A9Q3BJ91_9BASI|nr:hypothetical protein [Austropuccinia psidii MF-1]